jgi:murein peptide amidase A
MKTSAHSAHDVAALLTGWQQLAKKAKLAVTTLAEVDGVPIIALESAAAARGESAIYLSSGVHGDEAAAAWGLLSWAQQHSAQLRSEAFLICPCLNPAGLAENTRVDHRGLDLNRRFHMARDPIIGPWRRWLRGRPMTLGICCHEDYDGQGIYIYELSADARAAHARAALAACQEVLPHDPRRSMDGHRAKDGVVWRAGAPPSVVGPEAIVLREDFGCAVTLTLETGSEFALDTRMAAHVLSLHAAILHHRHLHG